MTLTPTEQRLRYEKRWLIEQLAGAWEMDEREVRSMVERDSRAHNTSGTTNG